MDSLTSDESHVQGVAADCFLEFFEWFDKSTTDSAANASRAKSMLKRISAYARHPDANKRFAAAFAFNKIYKEFRDKMDLGEARLDRVMLCSRLTFIAERPRAIILISVARTAFISSRVR